MKTSARTCSSILARYQGDNIPSRMADTEMTGPWYKVNRRLLPIKGLYFSLFSGIGSLLPFIPIYMKQLGLSPTEMGIIYGTMPFIAFFTRPMFGVVADKTQRPKVVLIACSLLAGLCYCLLLATPHQAMVSVKTHLQCSQQDSYIKDCHAIDQASHTVGQPNSCDIGLAELVRNPLFTKNDSRIPCEAKCRVSVTALQHFHVCFTNDIGTYSVEKCQPNWNESQNIHELKFTIDSLGNVAQNEVVGQEMTYNGQICKNFDLKNITYVGKPYWQVLCAGESVFDCGIECDDRFKHSCKQYGTTFWTFSIIFLFSTVFFAPVPSIIDAIAYDVLAEKRGRWGKQRLWGTLAFALFAVTSTSVMDSVSKSRQDIDYSVSFYIYGGCSVVTAMIAIVTQTSQSVRCHEMFKNMTSLLKYPEILVFMFIVSCFGIMNAVTEAFLFWYLQDLGSSQLNLGLCLVLSCTLEVFLLLFAGKIIKKIGHVPCLYIALLAYAVRFFGYTVITIPWYVLPIELLHGPCFGLMYAAASSYASIISPPGMSATVQGLIGGLYFGFGKGIGSFVTGKMFDSETGLGAVWTFRFYCLFALGLLILYASIHTLFFRKSQDQIDKPQDRKEDPEAKDDAVNGAAAAAGDKLLGTEDDVDI